MSKSESSTIKRFTLARRAFMTAAAAGALLAAPAFAQPSGAAAAPDAAYPSQTRSAQGAVWNHNEVALLLIDYQPEMFANIRSETSAAQVELNTRFLIKIANAFNIPVVLSTVGVEMGVNGPTVEAIAKELPGANIIDRSSMNAWEDPNFLAAVKATGKRRLIVGALYTEICLAYPVVEALAEGYEVTIINDGVGGLSQVAHAAAIDRMVHAGAIPNTVLALSTELFRDWKSKEASIARPIIMWYLQELKKIS
ncbi:isochorismatase family protein [Neorhizobium sp. T6_25]|uniref:isochorismatase family protein n=1 Tax=Neorhizobium sp. T6_25 TaxID=2093833 RepID=UPI000CF8ECD3|nr:isochorismatase family protein [Neorhizobium sp. T6_25]